MVEFDLQEGDLVRARVWAFFAQRGVRFVYYVFIVASPLAVIFGSRPLYKNLKPAQRHVRYVFAEEGFE